MEQLDPAPEAAQTRFAIEVECKVALTDADLRYLEHEFKRRLHAALVQKFASIEFKRS